jgi:hypothetical protein
MEGIAMNFIEKREMERFALALPAFISNIDENRNQQAFEVMIRNICSGGSFLKTDQPLSEGSHVKMNLILPLNKLKKYGGKKSRVDVSGSVIRTKDQGMAVRFDKNFKISPLTQ